jgi:hypothetical protein
MAARIAFISSGACRFDVQPRLTASTATPMRAIGHPDGLGSPLNKIVLRPICK